MKQAYYYFLFRIYWYYKIRWDESEEEAIFGVVTVSSLFLFLNVLTVETVLTICNVLPNNENILVVWIVFMVLLAIVNYFLFVRKKLFLKCKKNKKKDFCVVAYMIISFMIVLLVGYINRQKVYSERPPLPEHLRKESLEGRIRDWIRDL